MEMDLTRWVIMTWRLYPAENLHVEAEVEVTLVSVEAVVVVHQPRQEEGGLDAPHPWVEGMEAMRIMECP